MAVVAAPVPAPNPIWTCPRCRWGSPNDAVEFLMSALGGGPRAVQDVMTEAEAQGIATYRLKAAKKMLRVQFFRVGGRPGQWQWRLP